ncbi:hypothetical protein GLAREA_05060 [Glarea lozoyensis ATCC 20868]|uniref:Uncharacterized protein n=1 Tax=Glarea lozoyensis (strain ATCC 20868 / MF5171) TaxID=1116229 RepID=S3EBP0_GLAL2|nr:uncharacterized protein GLAREA_05060 [Glarea lozoyensis ATCC 20868]EPE35723.1 hypothetical protein GLAREA_05060 [Glarea lozoyensis ATCC 20868]
MAEHQNNPNSGNFPIDYTMTTGSQNLVYSDDFMQFRIDVGENQRFEYEEEFISAAHEATAYANGRDAKVRFMFRVRAAMAAELDAMADAQIEAEEIARERAKNGVDEDAQKIEEERKKEEAEAQHNAQVRAREKEKSEAKAKELAKADENFHLSCKKFFDNTKKEDFPIPPRTGMSCPRKGCVRGNDLNVCHHDIQRLFKGQDLLRERLRWHPDRFQSGTHNQELAKEMFQLLQVIIG